MAKSNSFFSIRRGSTKSHTYSGWQGQQVTKDRVVNVKNPRSAAQQNQRQKFAAVGNFYKYLKFILNHSWEGVSYGVNSYNKFMSLNVKNFNTASMIIPEYGSKVAEAGTYQVSEGSLAAPTVWSGSENGVIFGLQTLTAAGLKALFGVNDYITLVGLASTVEPDGTPNVSYQTIGFAIRFHKPTAADDTVITDANVLSLMAPEYIGAEQADLTVSAQEGTITITYGDGVKLWVLCYAQIASKTENGNSATLRSTSRLVLSDTVEELVASTNASNAESWPVGADYLLNGETVTPTIGD